MKSKTNAMTTIATTYGITRRGASRVLEGDALQHLGDAHAAVGRALQRIVHLLPLHDVERIRLARKQLTDGRVVDRVTLLLELLDDRCLLGDPLRLAYRRDATLDVLRRLDENLRQLARRLLHRRDVQHLEASRRAVEEVDDVVETR